YQRTICLCIPAYNLVRTISVYNSVQSVCVYQRTICLCIPAYNLV
ncbi:uncharacterized protein LOC132555343, partial [Ylistrum balloti]